MPNRLRRMEVISIKLTQNPFSLPGSFPRRIFAEVSAYTLHRGLPTFQWIFSNYWSRSAVVQHVYSLRPLCSRLHPIFIFISRHARYTVPECTKQRTCPPLTCAPNPNHVFFGNVFLEQGVCAPRVSRC